MTAVIRVRGLTREYELGGETIRALLATGGWRLGTDLRSPAPSPQHPTPRC